MPPARAPRFRPTAPLKALLVASIAVPALVFAAAAWQSYKNAFRLADDRARHISSMLEEHALKTLEAMTMVLRVADQQLRGVDNQTIATSRALWQEIRGLQKLSEQVGAIYYIDREGRNPLTTRLFPPSTLDFSDRDYWYEHRDSDRGVYIGRSYTGKISNQPIFNLSIRRTTPDGSFDGVIGTSGEVEYFERFYATAGMKEDNFSVVLVREDGEALVRYPAVNSPMQFAPDSLFLSHPDSQGVMSFTAVSPADGIERLYAAKKLVGYPLFVLYGIDRSSIIAAWRQELFIWCAISALVGAALFLTTWLALRRTREQTLAVARWQRASAALLRESEHRAKIEAALLQTQKQEAIGQLTGGISHDFNNLLAVILGNLELLRKRMPGDPRAHRLLDGAIKGAMRGAALTQRLLAFARRQELSPQVVDVPTLIDGMTDLIRRSLGPAIDVAIDFPDTLPTVRADESQLEMALLNIVINARDATLAGGSIAITAREARVPTDESGGLKAGSYVCLCVSDTGIGMDEQTLARATEPFFTTKGLGKGTGLGLSMVYGFAVQSGGTFRLRSKVEKGTTAEIWLPVDGHQAAKARPAETGGTEDTASPRKVLVVDDDTLVGDSLVAMLEDLGHSAIYVTSGQAALEQLRRDSTIDTVITDQAMPGMSGLQLAQFIRQQWPTLPVLLATGHGDLSGNAELRLPVLNKPFRERDLVEALEATVAARRGHAA